MVAAYGQILSQRMLDSTRRGGINLHGSILPLYRGAAPIQRAILEGQTKTGVSLMQMDKGMDTGAVIAIEELSIDPDETYTELQARLSELAASMAQEWMPGIVNGDYSSSPQDSEYATMAPKVEKQEAELLTSKNAGAEYNRFRAFTEAPGAFIRTRNGVLRLWKVRLASVQGPPGEILESKSSLVIAFSDGALDLLEVQPEGKKRMTGRDFANGARLRAGDSLIE